jgi:hypothetical protein
MWDWIKDQAKNASMATIVAQNRQIPQLLDSMIDNPILEQPSNINNSVFISKCILRDLPQQKKQA